jgi:hypothetical protein
MTHAARVTSTPLSSMSARSRSTEATSSSGAPNCSPRMAQHCLACSSGHGASRAAGPSRERARTTASGVRSSDPIRRTIARAHASPKALSPYEMRRFESSRRTRNARRGSSHAWPAVWAQCADTAVTTSGPSRGPRPFSSMPTNINTHASWCTSGPPGLVARMRGSGPRSTGLVASGCLGCSALDSVRALAAVGVPADDWIK